MAVPAGTRLGPYEILSALGAGGMGEVYRARDTKLNRDVALKVIAAAFALEPERLARFRREAQVLASLNHPHIGTIYGFEDSGETHALVLELVEGDTLADRIAGGPIPLEDALPIARQICEALEAAHEQGIIHRDLKPANIKVREDGVVKVLDFGLAKAVDSAVGGPPVPLLNSPTITRPAAMTRMGMILGTAAYMAPEQAKGKPVDRGADLWAFGVVLYEMLSGKPPFDGETVTDVLAAIVTRDPDWTALPANTPPPIRRLLHRCLERDRRKRLADAGDARYQIDDALAPPSAEDVPVVAPAPRVAVVLAWLPWTAAAVLALTAFVLWRQLSNNPADVLRYSIEAPARAPLALALRSAVAISRDGGTRVMVGTSEGVQRLFVRGRNSFESRALEGTEGASHPVISPDGQWVAFLTSTKLNKVPLAGGPVATLAEVSDPRGLSWDEDDTIVFVPAVVGGVFRISPGGGTPMALTALTEKGERTHRWPQLLPGGGAVLFTVGTWTSTDDYDNATIEVMTIPGNQRRVLLTGASMARYVSSGHLVFGRGRSLFAVPFDLDTLTVTGTAVTMVQGIAGDSATGAVHFAVSREGTLAYVPTAADAAMTRLAWVDPNGRVEFLPASPGDFADPSISPDGRHLAVSVIAGDGREIRIHDFERKTFTKLTFGGQNLTPVWSRDSAWVYYAVVERDGVASKIYRREADGSSEAEALVTLPNRIYLSFISPDGTMVFDQADAAEEFDISRIALVKGAVPETIVSTPFAETGARLSPDGRWLAYQSLEAGRPEVFVRPFDGGGRWLVSTAGGEEPKWSGDGRQLFYRSADVLMAVPIEKSATFQFGTPAELFSGVYRPRTDQGFIYDVHPRLEKFVMLRPAQQEPATNLVHVVENWFNELRR